MAGLTTLLFGGLAVLALLNWIKVLAIFPALPGSMCTLLLGVLMLSIHHSFTPLPSYPLTLAIPCRLTSRVHVHDLTSRIS